MSIPPYIVLLQISFRCKPNSTLLASQWLPVAVLVWRSSGPVARKRGAISRNWAGGGFARKRTKTKGIEQTSDESLCTTIPSQFSGCQCNLSGLDEPNVFCRLSILNELKLWVGCCCFCQSKFFADSPLKCDLRFMNLFANFSPIKNQKQASPFCSRFKVVQHWTSQSRKRKIFGRIGSESGLAWGGWLAGWSCQDSQTIIFGKNCLADLLFLLWIYFKGKCFVEFESFNVKHLRPGWMEGWRQSHILSSSGDEWEGR